MTRIQKTNEDSAGAAGKTAAPEGNFERKGTQRSDGTDMESQPNKLVISSRKVVSDRNQPQSQSFIEDREQPYEKVVVSVKNIGGKLKYQAEQFTRTQVFHRNMEPHEVPSYIVSLFEAVFAN